MASRLWKIEIQHLKLLQDGSKTFLKSILVLLVFGWGSFNMKRSMEAISSPGCCLSVSQTLCGLQESCWNIKHSKNIWPQVWRYEQLIGPAEQGSQQLQKAHQWMQAWSARRSPDRCFIDFGFKHNEPTTSTWPQILMCLSWLPLMSQVILSSPR